MRGVLPQSRVSFNFRQKLPRTTDKSLRTPFHTFVGARAISWFWQFRRCADGYENVGHSGFSSSQTHPFQKADEMDVWQLLSCWAPAPMASVFLAGPSSWLSTCWAMGSAFTAFDAAWTERDVLLVGIGDSVTAGRGIQPSSKSYFNRLIETDRRRRRSRITGTLPFEGTSESASRKLRSQRINFDRESSIPGATTADTKRKHFWTGRDDDRWQ